MRDWDQVQGLRDERHIGSFDIFDHGDFFLLEIVHREIAHCVSENTLLDQHNICPTRDDFLDQTNDIFSFLFQDFIDLVVVLHDDVVIHVGLRTGQTELQESHLRILNIPSSWNLDTLMRNDYSIEKLDIIDGPSQFGFH